MTAKGLNQAQEEAVRFDKNKPLIILAGAGSGKTKVLTHRAAFFAESLGKDSGEILLLTFTNKAAGEMMSRVNTIIGDKTAAITGGTFHSFCLRLLRNYGEEAEISKNFVVFDENDQLETIKRAMNLLGADSKINKPRAILAAISDAKNNLVGAKDYATYAKGPFQTLTARVYNTYQILLNKYNGMDFDDLLINSIKLLKNDLQINEKVTNKYKYVLIDEYQDTNTSQFELTKLLTGKHRRLTVVGDAAQAIYSWRGANYKNLLYLKKEFPEITVLNLEQNYRSTGNILSAANKIISQNKHHPILKLWTQNPEGGKVSVYEAENEIGEANFIIEKIRHELIAGKKLSDFAVLYRTNAQSRVIEESFLRTGIPYTLIGGYRFYERKEVKDILAYLRILANSDDDISRSRAEKVGKIRLSKLLNAKSEINLFNNTEDILNEVLRHTQYLDMFNQEDEEDFMRLENIKELKSVAIQFPELTEFLQQITLTENQARGRGKRSNDATTLMTVHSAKGLEFDTVFMAGMEEGLFPHSRSLMDREQMEEERRLCYVGMTRAKNKLHMSYALGRIYFGQKNQNVVSRFLSDIPEDLIERNISTYQRKARASYKKIASEGWGFDEKGEWKWKPD